MAETKLKEGTKVWVQGRWRGTVVSDLGRSIRVNLLEGYYDKKNTVFTYSRSIVKLEPHREEWL